MRELGLAALAHAHQHAGLISSENARWAELSVLQAAHAAELLIKARIAQEHPLLVFDTLPRPAEPNSLLDFEGLFERGKTLEWSDLPARLWAVTGKSVPDRPLFDRFGKFRNAIQHFAPPAEQGAGERTLEFTFRVIDPFLNENWGLCAIDYQEDYEPYVYLAPRLIEMELPFTISREAAETFKDWDVDWNKVSNRQRSLIEKRVSEALSAK